MAGLATGLCGETPCPGEGNGREGYVAACRHTWCSRADGLFRCVPTAQLSTPRSAAFWRIAKPVLWQTVAGQVLRAVVKLAAVPVLAVAPVLAATSHTLRSASFHVSSSRCGLAAPPPPRPAQPKGSHTCARVWCVPQQAANPLSSTFERAAQQQALRKKINELPSEEVRVRV